MARSAASQRRQAAGFDFTWHMRLICQDMIARLPELQHIDLARVAVSFSQTRKAVSHGTLATLTPMRFEGGALVSKKGRRTWTVQRLFNDAGDEMLYILSFYMPRFLAHPLREKLITIAHELWHISPEFNGDIRRHPGRCYAHSHSKDAYDEKMGQLIDKWLAAGPDESLYGFLQFDFAELSRRHGPVYGTRIPRPKLLPFHA